MITKFETFLNENKSIIIDDIDNIRIFLTEDIVKKLLCSVNTFIINVCGIEIEIESIKQDSPNELFICITSIAIKMFLLFNRKEQDIEEYINKVYEYIQDVYYQQLSLNDKINKGAKKISIVQMKKMILQCLPEYCGNMVNVKSGSDYLLLCGKNIRFSDHERPYNSKWNNIHGQNYIDCIRGYITKESIVKFLNNICDGNLTDDEINKINNYFNLL